MLLHVFETPSNGTLMPRLHRRNLGTTSLPIRKRSEDPMAAYDRLPPDLRAWMQDAALPWSPRSCRAIWQKVKQRGGSDAEAAARLAAVEAAMLARDRQICDR
jgi:hypothetical protein